MRKIDYQILADIIRDFRALYADLKVPERVATCEIIAREFSKRAGVKPAEFLRACGIEE